MAVGKFRTSGFSFLLMIFSLLFSSTGNSLGLGNIESGSLLGEPLQVRIPVLDSLKEYRAEDLIVRKLDNKQAEALGFEIVTSSYGITVSLEDSAGGVMLLARSKSPITEPFISFFVELQWPQGSLIREYTLLLDPPALPSAVPASVPSNAPVKTEAKARTVSKNPDLTKTASSAVASVPTASSKTISANASDYRVQSGDSLSAIAGRWVSGQLNKENIQEATQWLFENNPRAFVGGDINRLMAGARLQLPENGLVSKGSDSVRPESQSAMEADVAPSSTTAVTQPEATGDSRAWMGNLPQRPEEMDAALQQAAKKNPKIAADDPAGLVRLSQDAEGPDQVPSFAELESESPESVQTYLDSTRETIDVLRRENAQLNRQIEAIENSDYLNNLKELVELQRLQLAQLKSELNAADPSLEDDVERYAAIVADRAINSVDGKVDSRASVQSDAGDKPDSLIQIEEDINLQNQPVVERETGRWVAALGLFLLAVILFLMIVRRLWLQQQDKFKTRTLPIATAPVVVGGKGDDIQEAKVNTESETDDFSELLDENFKLDREDLEQFGPVDINEGADGLIAADMSAADESLGISEFEDMVPEIAKHTAKMGSIDDDWDDLFDAIISKQVVEGKEPEGFDLELDIEEFLDDDLKAEEKNKKK